MAPVKRFSEDGTRVHGSSHKKLKTDAAPQTNKRGKTAAPVAKAVEVQSDGDSDDASWDGLDEAESEHDLSKEAPSSAIAKSSNGGPAPHPERVANGK